MSKYGESSKGIDVEEHLFHAQLGVRELRKEVNKLELENARLRDELENNRVLTSQPKHSGRATDDDTNLEELKEREKEVETLKQTVSKAKKENSKLRKELEDLRKSSLEEEVEGLEIDPGDRMRKLLEKFSDLMLSTTGDKKCSLCNNPLQVKECSALVCRHPICHVCLPEISRAATRDTEALRCTQCGTDTPRERLKLIYMAETDCWNELTKVARAFMAFDRRRELESSEEEEEENFITDGDGTSQATSEDNGNRTMDDAQDQEESEGSRQASPLPSASGLLFSDSPSKLKRKRTEELAAERSQRKRT